MTTSPVVTTHDSLTTNKFRIKVPLLESKIMEFDVIDKDKDENAWIVNPECASPPMSPISREVYDAMKSLVKEAIEKLNARHNDLKLFCYEENDKLYVGSKSIRCVGRVSEVIELSDNQLLPFSSIEIELEISPKIGWDHFLSLYVYAMSPNDKFPDFSISGSLIEHNLSLFMALRYLQILRIELENGLFQGYNEKFDEELPFLRGSLKPVPFALNLAQGQLEFVCDFEEFGLDTPVNRVLKRALSDAVGILRSVQFRAGSDFYNKHVNQALHWFDVDFEDVGRYRELDLEAEVPAHQSSIAASFEIAKELIQRREQSLMKSESYVEEIVLTDTDALMEAALIALLGFTLYQLPRRQIFSLSSKSSNKREWNRFKKNREDVPKVPWSRLGWKGTGDNKWSFQPDICIHDANESRNKHIVGDVKYYRPTLLGGTIKDSIRYQSLYFMAVYESRRGLVLNFTEDVGTADVDSEPGKYIIHPSDATHFEPNREAGVDKGLSLFVVSWDVSLNPRDAFEDFQSKICDAYDELMSF